MHELLWFSLPALVIGFGLGGWIWPKIVGEEERLRAEIRTLEDQLANKLRRP